MQRRLAKTRCRGNLNVALKPRGGIKRILLPAQLLLVSPAFCKFSSSFCCIDPSSSWLSSFRGRQSRLIDDHSIPSSQGFTGISDHATLLVGSLGLLSMQIY